MLGRKTALRRLKLWFCRVQPLLRKARNQLQEMGDKQETQEDQENSGTHIFF